MRCFAIKTFRLDLIRQAIEFFIDNPCLSNREVARRINVSESRIREWKQQPFWEQERLKILKDQAKLLPPMSESEKEEQRRKIKQRQENLEKLARAMETTAAQALTAANKVYAEVAQERSAIKACERATKAGAHVQAATGIKTVEAIARVNKQLDEGFIFLEYLSDEDEEDE